MILLDGSFGTCLWGKAEKKGIEQTPVWMYNITQPEMVEELCVEYLKAGTQIIQTNTFSANKETLDRYGWDLKENIKAATEIARRAIKSLGNEGLDRKVSLDVGPLPRYLDPIGDMTEKEAEAGFSEIIEAGLNAGVDQIFLETFTDLNLMEVALRPALKSGLKVFCSFSFDERGKTLCGDAPSSIVDRLSHYEISALGINCSAGPKAAYPVLCEYQKAVEKLGLDVPLIFKPNVDSEMTPTQFAADCQPAMAIAEYLGACCGSSPEFIKAF